MSTLELMARDAELEKDPALIDEQTRSLSMIVREVQAWRIRFPRTCARVNAELDFFRKCGDGEPVTAQDEIDLWRRWHPDFRFRPQDDVVALRLAMYQVYLTNFGYFAREGAQLPSPNVAIAVAEQTGFECTIYCYGEPAGTWSPIGGANIDYEAVNNIVQRRQHGKTA